MIHRQLPHRLRFALLAIALVSFSGIALAQGDQVSDLRPASILFFNKYTSNPSAPQLQDTQINLTNVNPNDGVNVHMFMVDGSTCSIADFYLGLSQNQTGTFLASDFDPGTQGYIVAVAADFGSPVQFNYLIGDLLIREQDGKLASLGAVGVRRINPNPVVPNGDGTASLIFNGAEYERLPSMVGASSFNSQVTHSTNLAIYSPSANLMFGAVTTTSIFTLVFNDQEVPHSTTIRVSCYVQLPLLSLKVTGGNVNAIVGVGRTGWLKLNAINRPLMGAILTKGPVFNGGHNLHSIVYLPTYTILVPAF